MTIFLRLLSDKDKALSLTTTCTALRTGESDPRMFQVTPESFRAVPGAPFAYWVSDAVRSLFKNLPAFESGTRTCRMGMATANDYRFVRAWWEVCEASIAPHWFPMAKGGSFSPFYSDVGLSVKWTTDDPPGKELKAFAETTPGTTHWSRNLRNVDFYFRAGLTWPLRTHRFCPQVLPANSIISVRGSGIYVDNPDVILAFMSSSAADYLMKMVSGRDAHPQFDGGDISLLPLPEFSQSVEGHLAEQARRAWSLKRALDTVEETSHAFQLPAALRARSGDYDPPAIEAELARIQAEIDEVAFDLYGFSDADRAAVNQPLAVEATDNAQDEAEDEGEAAELPADTQPALLSWAVGVAFGRFDWRLATGERTAPPEPEPFDPLPVKSPGMLPDGFDPFHRHPGLLVDDPGHPHDLAHLVEEVLTRVEAPAPDDVRRWLQRDFFTFHLQRYSKSRRKAPIYWPLATASGSYTLWIYYPSLSSQTLYTAINDFIEPKLKQVGADVTALRNKGAARTREDEKQFEALQAFELELIELRDTLLTLAPTYKPDHDDGVQITATPLWPLFRHKPWQKLLKETWAKLEKGDYDWAHLAMNYRPNQVREKCKTDKSLAIAHGLEGLYVEPEAKSKKTRGHSKELRGDSP